MLRESHFFPFFPFFFFFYWLCGASYLPFPHSAQISFKYQKIKKILQTSSRIGSLENTCDFKPSFRSKANYFCTCVKKSTFLMKRPAPRLSRNPLGGPRRVSVIILFEAPKVPDHFGPGQPGFSGAACCLGDEGDRRGHAAPPSAGLGLRGAGSPVQPGRPTSHLRPGAGVRTPGVRAWRGPERLPAHVGDAERRGRSGNWGAGPPGARRRGRPSSPLVRPWLGRSAYGHLG